MANTIQLKRRVSGLAGAPAALKSGELAHNEVDDTLYVGKGDDGAGNATSVIPLAGKGGFVDLTGAQTIGGAKTFTLVPKSSQDASAASDLIRKSQLDGLLAGKAPLASPALTGTPSAPTAVSGTNSTQIATTAFVQQATVAFGPGDMLKSTYDADNDGKVDAAEMADAAPWAGITGKPTSFPPATHAHAVGEVTGLQAALDAKAPLASPALTGTPTAPSASHDSTVAAPSLAPAVAPIISTASTCSVIGTGQKGTCTLEASVSSATPSPRMTALWASCDWGQRVERRLPFMCMFLKEMT